MRFFIVMCMLAAVNADNSGYNYQPSQQSDPGASYSAPSVSYLAPSGSSYSAPAEAASSASAPSYSAPVLNKEFFSFSANDELVQPASSDQINSVLKKNLRVIFIKGPEQHGLEDAAASLAKQSSEQKTAIYVLHKQADLSELANKLKNSGDGNNSPPEVHFVKYRTPEDAANAQRTIQSQYDSAPGPSQSINGGVAPSINFASQAPVQQHQGSAATPQSSYLPASIIKRFRF